MSAVMPLYNLIEMDVDNFTQIEKNFLDTVLFLNVCEELKMLLFKEYKNYFLAIKDNVQKEKVMLEQNFIGCILNDILATKEYSLAGIAYYTDTPEDVLYDVIAGTNINPAFSLVRKVIELHRLIRSDLYLSLLNKVIQSDPE